ncbi:MAG: 16S rRNA (cytosine(1402)-N(4))-methyltransferase RsmH [Elusimicrobiota bacterium]
MKTNYYHKPVLAKEVIKVLCNDAADIIVDGTVGEGGHSELILKRLTPGGLLIGIDRDSEMLKVAEKRLSDIQKEKASFKLFNGSYENLDKILGKLNIDCVDGILLDLGFSQRQIATKKRGFSFKSNEKLDMRYNTNFGMPVHGWINKAPAGEIEKVLKNYGQEYESKRIAKKIQEYRKNKKIMTARELQSIVSKAKRSTPKGRNPATKTFQALRIFINNELNILKESLPKCLKLLSCSASDGHKGRLAVLTYHSLEDRIVKSIFRKFSGKCECPPDFPVCRCGADTITPRIKILKESGLQPTEREVNKNRSARSAHLRACEIVKR